MVATRASETQQKLVLWWRYNHLSVLPAIGGKEGKSTNLAVLVLISFHSDLTN